MPIKHGQKIKCRPIFDCECGDHSFVATTRGYVTLVSPEDRYLLEAHSWTASVVSTDLVYAIKTRIGLLHRVIINPSRKDLIDHCNRNGSDNRRSNLRICTKSQNSANSRARNGLKGTRRYKKTEKYVARITVNGKERHLGIFNTEQEAHEVYFAALKAAFGEFARAE